MRTIAIFLQFEETESTFCGRVAPIVGVVRIQNEFSFWIERSWKRSYKRDTNRFWLEMGLRPRRGMKIYIFRSILLISIATYGYFLWRN